jgi:hypothetical protein
VRGRIIQPLSNNWYNQPITSADWLGLVTNFAAGASRLGGRFFAMMLGAMSTAYERRKSARQQANERRLLGETLAAFHAREIAKPPTIAEIYRQNHVNRERCPWTIDLEQLCLAKP